MNKGRKIYLWSVFYVLIVFVFVYMYIQNQYLIYLSDYTNQFYDIESELNNVIESVKAEQSILSESFDQTDLNRVDHKIGDKSYLSLFQYSYETLRSPFTQANLYTQKFDWINDLYTSDLQKVIINAGESTEDITIGSRYGIFNSNYSGVIAITIDLKQLVEDIVREHASGDEMIIVSDAKGSILYHKDYINANKPNISELYPQGTPINSNTSQINISKVVYQGKSYVLFQRELLASDLQLTYVVPWLEIFYQWQIYTIALIIFSLMLSINLIALVRNSVIVDEIKKILKLKSRSLNDNHLELISKNVEFKSEMATYFELELQPISQTLKILEAQKNELYNKHKQYIINYLEQKSSLIAAHSRGEINYDKAWLKKFEILDIIELINILMTSTAEAKDKKVNIIDTNILSQEIYSYPDAIWIITLSIFDELIHFHDEIDYSVSMRGELVFVFKTKTPIKFEDSKLSLLSNLVQEKYNAKVKVLERAIHFEWPVIKMNHLPNQMIDRFDGINIALFKLNFASERLINIIGDQLHFNLIPFDSTDCEAHIVIVEADGVLSMTKEDLSRLKTYKNVILLYQPNQHNRFQIADTVNAKVMIVLPLNTEM